jgi:sporulation protein YabP
LDEFELGEKDHRIEILHREQVRIHGVIHVESFDERQVVVETDLGMITMIGEEFHITSLDLDKGLMILEGAFTGLEYSGLDRAKSRQKDKGFLQRLFR